MTDILSPLVKSVNCGAGWSGRWESNPPHQLGRLAHYHYATPASNAPPSYTSSRLTVKSKPGALRHAARRHDRVGHTVEDFLVGGADRGQDAAELRVVAHHEVVRAE